MLNAQKVQLFLIAVQSTSKFDYANISFLDYKLVFSYKAFINLVVLKYVFSFVHIETFFNCKVHKKKATVFA